MKTVQIKANDLLNSNDTADKNLNSIRENDIDSKKMNENEEKNIITETNTNSNNSKNIIKTKSDEISPNKINISINSIKSHEEHILKYRVKKPKENIRAKIHPLEQELFSLLNMEWEKDLTYEDLLLVDDIEQNNESYYVHLLRSGTLDPKKENFVLLHGLLSSSTHYLAILPYLIRKYNVFIPDTIGMGLSTRPQIKFKSPEECENYFVEILYIIIKKLFFSNKYNIKKDFYLGGHSLGGFIVSRYIIKYPKGVKKVLFLSAAGITDYRIKGTNILKEAGGLLGCFLSFSGCCWACRPTFRGFYKCICLKPFIKSFMGKYYIKIDYDYIKPNEDGSKFIVDTKSVLKILGRLSKITLDYPDDIYNCLYYFFTVPPPAAVNPVELKILNDSKLKCIFVFGESDWMDRTGAYRLCQRDRSRFKMFIVTGAGHSFAMENPKELENILDAYF